MLAVLNGSERMIDAGERMTGGLDDDIDIIARNQLTAAFQKSCCGDPLVAPADGAAGGARPLRRQIGDGGTVKPGLVGTCDRNMEPNLPAPIRPTRTGCPDAPRSAASRARFMIFPVIARIFDAESLLFASEAYFRPLNRRACTAPQHQRLNFRAAGPRAYCVQLVGEMASFCRNMLRVPRLIAGIRD